MDLNAYTRILNNLLPNVIFHSKGRRVSLLVFNDDEQARITIKDNGVGILPADLPYVFERMYWGDQSRSANGNGLGLAIAKELVAAHGGTITADSVPGNGATFTINFPKVL